MLPMIVREPLPQLQIPPPKAAEFPENVLPIIVVGPTASIPPPMPVWATFFRIALSVIVTV